MSQSPFTPTDQLSITDETALDVGDNHLIFTKEELNRMNIKLLRRLAAACNVDGINGKSTKLEIISALRCQYSLSEYAED